MNSQLYKSNGIYTSYTSTTGRDCRTMEPGTQCFCQHVYKDHKTNFEHVPKERPIKLPCRAPGCKCSSYHYVPAKCCSAIKCHCKHAPEEHEEFGNLVCKRAGYNTCTGFTSSLLCGCGVSISEHKMTVETGAEREIRLGCHTCTEFTSSLLCGCDVPTSEHKMTVETGAEREVRR